MCQVYVAEALISIRLRFSYIWAFTIFKQTLFRIYFQFFSLGYNCGEAVNFAPLDWVDYGEECRNRYNKNKRAYCFCK